MEFLWLFAWYHRCGLIHFFADTNLTIDIVMKYE